IKANNCPICFKYLAMTSKKTGCSPDYTPQPGLYTMVLFVRWNLCRLICTNIGSRRMISRQTVTFLLKKPAAERFISVLFSEQSPPLKLGNHHFHKITDGSAVL